MAKYKPEYKVFAECFLCRRSVRVGEHVYEGSNIPAWGVFMCFTCQKWNWDGIVPETYPHLIPYLQSKGISIKLNNKGWLDIPR